MGLADTSVLLCDSAVCLVGGGSLGCSASCDSGLSIAAVNGNPVLLPGLGSARCVDRRSAFDFRNF